VVAALALGCAPLAGLYEAVPEEQARATIDAAWEAGIRMFDTAPHYAAGVSERRLGAALRDRPRGEAVISTKVGRLLLPAGEHDQEGFPDEPPVRRVFDFGRDGVRRSLEGSLERLGVDRADIVHLHDPDDHLDQAIGEALPALAELRAAGAVGAVGAGSNRVAPLARIVREADVDWVLVAGRFTLLDQSAAAELLPLCLERGVGVIAAGVVNSGVLAGGTTYDYRAAPPEVLERARAIAAACARHGVTVTDAAVAYPRRHEAVRAVLVGARSPAEVAADAAGFGRAIPEALWEELGV
jgi:D-threo-aldose 1-dehydrogenase